MQPDPITIVVQIVLGLIVKHWPALASLPNKLIPVFNFVIAILIGLGTGQAEAGGLGGFFSGGFGQLLVNAALNTLLSTGTHSMGKNFLQQLTRK